MLRPTVFIYTFRFALNGVTIVRLQHLLTDII